MTSKELIKHYQIRINNLRKEIMKLKREVEVTEDFIRDLEELRDE